MNTDSASKTVSNYTVCGFEICDGNRDDPSYAYCGERIGHGGPHGKWIY